MCGSLILSQHCNMAVIGDNSVDNDNNFFSSRANAEYFYHCVIILIVSAQNELFHALHTEMIRRYIRGLASGQRSSDYSLHIHAVLGKNGSAVNAGSKIITLFIVHNSLSDGKTKELIPNNQQKRARSRFMWRTLPGNMVQSGFQGRLACKVPALKRDLARGTAISSFFPDSPVSPGKKAVRTRILWPL